MLKTFIDLKYFGMCQHKFQSGFFTYLILNTGWFAHMIVARGVKYSQTRVRNSEFIIDLFNKIHP